MEADMEKSLLFSFGQAHSEGFVQESGVQSNNIFILTVLAWAHSQQD